MKKLFSIIMCALMVMSLMPSMAFAASSSTCTGGDGCTHEVAIGNVHYDTLAEAVTAAENETSDVTITLLADVSINKTLDLTGVTKLKYIKFEGHTLTATNCTALKIGGTVEIQDKTGITEHGGVTANGDDVYAIDYVGTGKLTFHTFPAIKGDIINNGTGTIWVYSGTYTGNVVNESAGTIEFKGGTTKVATLDGDLKNNGAGTIKTTFNAIYKIDFTHKGTITNGTEGKVIIQIGKFSNDPSAYVDASNGYCVAKDDTQWTVSKLTVKNAVKAGYVAGSAGYTKNTANYNGTFYKSLADAANSRSEIHLLTNVDLSSADQSGFAFTWAATATDPFARQFYLEGNTYKGSITDDTKEQKPGESPVSERNKTIIDGDKDSHNTTTQCGTAILTKITTKVVLAVQNKADVTVTTGSANGIEVDATSTLTINGGTYTGTITVANDGTLTVNGGSFKTNPTGLRNVTIKQGCFAKYNSTTKYYDIVAISSDDDAVTAGAVAAEGAYNGVIDYKGTYYDTLASAASASSSISMLQNATSNADFNFTYGSTNEKDADHTLYLRGHQYSGTVNDESDSTQNSTIFDGNGSSTKTETGRGTATLAGITTKKTLKVQNNADVAVTTGSAGGIDVDGTSTLTINGGTYTGTLAVASGGTLKITDGTFEGTLPASVGGTLFIEGGTFNSDPTAYLEKNEYVAKKSGDKWVVTRLTVGEAVEKGYVAGIYKYINEESPWYGPYYETVQEAANVSNRVALLKDMNLAAKGFTFTYGATASTIKDRTLYLQGKKYQGSITDNTTAQSTTTNNATIIDGNNALTYTKSNRGTAIISDITTNGVLKIQNNADVTINGTGSKTAGINVNGSSTLTINGGTYTGTVMVSDGGKLTITAGTYDVDVTKYCTEGYMATLKSNGKYVVGLIPDDAAKSAESKVEVEESVKQGKDVVKDADGVDKTIAETVASNVDANLKNTTKNITISSIEMKKVVKELVATEQVKLDNDNNVVPYNEDEDVTVTIIKEPYLEVEVKSLTINTSTGENELKLDITPKYNLYATTDPEDESKTVTVSTGNLLTVSEDTLVTIQLPEGFASSGEKLLVKHDKHDGSVEYYTGSVSDNGQGTNYLSFTTSGFSTFTAIRDYAACIGDGDDMKVYPTLQSAVDAVKNGETIKLYKDGETAVVKRTVSFKVDPSYEKDGTKGNYTYTIALGDGTTRNKTDNENEWSTVYTAPASETAKTDTTKAAKAPATGDNSELGLFAVAGLISAVGVALLLRRKQSM